MPRRRATNAVDLSTWQGRLRAARIDSEISAEVLAEKVGVKSPNSIYDWENPAKNKTPDPDRLAKLIDALDQRADWILQGRKEARVEEGDLVRHLTMLARLLEPRDLRSLLVMAEHYVERDREERREAESGRLTPAQRRKAEQGVEP